MQNINWNHWLDLAANFAGNIVAATLDTPDGAQTLAGNNKIFSDTIQNFSANPARRVDLKAQLASRAGHAEAIRLLEFSALGPVLAAAGFPAPEQAMVVRQG
ncbi:mechanosensitive ion channel family protein [Chromobacterium subtsugae]|uniref:mechanosensitive ion channel family protein n=1 Tax=Chromobacterium subtsugae TaxID=251747 RepID=UPI000640FE76|nr:mechanosensitive ion channel family protein [Chromobacterium subtsugae]OBU86275.1 hypothetical protein MY55_11440 [Chromobacterium subtsugae]